ncbi:MAG: 3-deoxy-manno-octulosonate cytidylyltransferase [Bacteroidales bacterium]|nr:3-deoxy-manno-octulosonate cytidylyltransferase [Bacteroidales bacterium]
MRVIGIIPARYQSSRFPGKPLVDIKGKSMIRRVYEQVSSCNNVTEVLVATDDKRIVDHVQDFGGKVVMTSSDHQTGTERCAEAFQLFNKEFEIVVNIQGDEPFIDPEQINSVISCFKTESVQIATLVKRITDREELSDPNLVRVVLGDQNNILYFSRQIIPYFRDDPIEKWLVNYTYYRHVGLYAFRPGVLTEIVKLPMAPPEKAESLEQLRWLYYGYKMKAAITDIESHSVDTPEDLLKIINRF